MNHLDHYRNLNKEISYEWIKANDGIADVMPDEDCEIRIQER